MKKYYNLSAAVLSLVVVIFIALSCEKDVKQAAPVIPPTPSPVPTGSFVEEFDHVSDLSSKGWVFVNNSDPIGESGWRQGRYESINLANKKLTAGVVAVGFPAYSAHNSPNDFVSCDITACANVTGTGSYSAWLISPPLPMSNGDKIIFYTIANNFAIDPTNGYSTTDRVQLRLNFNDGSANVGSDTASIGKFNTLLYDSNPYYINNNAGGHPIVWKKISKTITGVPGGSIPNGRFAFRYYAHDAGLYGGSTGANFPSVLGIDSLAFIHN
jgi:hypothetical protein